MNISLRQHLVVNIKYAYQRANTAYYQRKIPCPCRLNFEQAYRLNFDQVR